MNDLPLVSLGQGDYRRDLHAADLAGKGVLGSIISAVLREPAETYHANASRHLSSHALGEFRRCPLLYRRRKLGLVPDRDSPAYLLGRAAHTLILEGRVAYERAFAVGGPINHRTGQPYGAGHVTGLSLAALGAGHVTGLSLAALGGGATWTEWTR